MAKNINYAWRKFQNTYSMVEIQRAMKAYRNKESNQ